jgi:hypothetical protein
MPFSRGRAIGGLSAHLNRQERQERKDIALDLLRISNKGIFFALFAVFAVQFDENTGGHLKRCPPDDSPRDGLIADT